MQQDKPKSKNNQLWGKHVIEYEGDKYMTRYWIGRLRLHIFHRGDADTDLHDHPWGFWTFPLRSYVEEYMTGGTWTETVKAPEIVEYDGLSMTFDPIEYEITRSNREVKTRVVRAFRLHYRPPEFAHRLLGAYNDETGYEPHGFNVPTIVWRTGVKRNWGFWKRDGWCWLPWKQYVFDGGREAPCSEIVYGEPIYGTQKSPAPVLWYGNFDEEGD